MNSYFNQSISGNVHFSYEPTTLHSTIAILLLYLHNKKTKNYPPQNYSIKTYVNNTAI